MSKYIPTDNKPEKQVKAKLKIKVTFNGENHVLNEYDLAAMVSDLNVKIMQLTDAVNGITTAMSAATKGIDVDSGPQLSSTSVPKSSTIKLPKLQSVKSNLDSSHIYPNSIDAPKLES